MIWIICQTREFTQTFQNKLWRINENLLCVYVCVCVCVCVCVICNHIIYSMYYRYMGSIGIYLNIMPLQNTYKSGHPIKSHTSSQGLSTPCGLTFTTQ